MRIRNRDMSTATATPKTVFVTCSRCDGTGSLPWTSYAQGVCFQCKGAGGRTLTEAKSKKAQQAKARKEAKRAMAQAQRLAGLKSDEERCAQLYGELWTRLMSLAAQEFTRYGSSGIAGEALINLRMGLISASVATAQADQAATALSQ